MSAKSIAELRAEKGISQVDLARISGVHPVSINRYESGKIVPSLRNLRRIADALGVDLDAISFDTVPPSAVA